MNQAATESIGTLMEPDPIGFSFLAPGWGYLLLLLILAGIIYGIVKFLKYRKNRYRREAIGILNSIAGSGHALDHQIFRIAETVKRVSVQSYGRAGVATLNGVEWMDFLAEKNKGEPVFSDRSKAMFTEQLYRKDPEELSADAVQEVINESITWIKDHHV